MSTKQPDRLKNLYLIHVEQEDHFALISHSALKRRRMKQDTEEQTSAAPGTAHGEGWSAIRPDSDELYVAGVKIGERQADGTFTKLFRALVKPSVLKKKRAKFRRKIRELDKSIAVAAKQEARLALFLMGKY